MKTAQYFIDALRSGDYFEALGFFPYVKEKYLQIDPGLVSDVFIPLCIYELSKTDIQPADFEEICFLHNYFSLLKKANACQDGDHDFYLTNLACAAAVFLDFPTGAIAQLGVKVDDREDLTQLTKFLLVFRTE